MPPDEANRPLPDLSTLRSWAGELGFRHFGVADASAFADAGHGQDLQAWLAAKCHGEMAYMAREPERRASPAALVPGTVSALMVGIDYAPPQPDWIARGWQQLGLADDAHSTDSPGGAYVSNYARGRDYHKLVRKRLQKLAQRIASAIGPFGYRAFCDSAPVMEVALATRAGLGWRGKHTLLLNRPQGSMFFLGTLYTDLPLAPSEPVTDHCGSCTQCISACPTRAIVAPYRLDARRCISYLTIELHGPIPVALRPLIGNRVYGCDDCQLACPWNKFAQPAATGDFAPRHGLSDAQLISLFSWTAAEFDVRTTGSAIRRIGYQRWLRNIAVALGNLDVRNTPASLLADARQALLARRARVDPMVREHIDWALQRLRARPATPGPQTGQTCL